MKFILILILLSFAGLAQFSEQPAAESSSDLRSQVSLFSIEIVADKKIFTLERTPNSEHFLRLKVKDEDFIKKVDSREAKKLDMEFASKFLRCQYEINAVPGECNLTHRLKMKGESQEICAKDELKAQEIKALIKTLKKKF